MSTGYTPTKEDLVSVIRLLHENGIEVRNSKQAYAQLMEYQSNPSFCILLAKTFESTQCPVDIQLPVAWVSYRQLAGITLKNNIEAAQYALGEEAVKEAAKCSFQALMDPPDARIARVSAQIVVKVTKLTSFDWWSQTCSVDIAGVLLNQLLPAGGVKTLSALYCLQYLMEDLPKEIGQASESILTQVSQMALLKDRPLDIRKAAFRMCLNCYEQCAILDWNVDELSPLQQGVVAASSTVASVCTQLLSGACDNDAPFVTSVFRACSFLLEYFDYMPPLSPQQQDQIRSAWIGTAVNVIVNGQFRDTDSFADVLGCAIDLLTYVVKAYDQSGGEGNVAFLVAPVCANVVQLVGSLIQYAVMSDDEVQTIMEKDDYHHRDAMAVAVDMKDDDKDITQDETTDEESAMTNLRSASLMCISVLCNLASSTVFQPLVQQIQQLWSSSEWKNKELGTVLVGTIAEGCSAELSTFIGPITDQLLQLCSAPSEHVCVTSIAAWSLSHTTELILTYAPDRFDKVALCLINRLQSTSKRIQLTTVSALTEIMSVLDNYGDHTALAAHFPALLESIKACLPVYNTRNLSLLIDVVCSLFPLLQNQQVANTLGTLLKNERGLRAQKFVESYTAVYVQEASNDLVDKDVFQFDRAVITFLHLYPDPPYAIESLGTWNGVLSDLITRGVIDDPDLVYNVLLLCGGYAGCAPTQSLQQWVQGSSWGLTKAAYHFFSSAKNRQVKICALSLIRTFLHFLGEQGIPDSVFQPLLSSASSMVLNEEDIKYKEAMIATIASIISNWPQSLPEAGIQDGISALNSVMRSDVYGNSLAYYAQMAFDVCKMLSRRPQLVPSLNMTSVVLLMAQTANDVRKSEATNRLCPVLANSGASFMQGILPDAMKLVYSWQMAAGSFPGTHEALLGLVHAAAQTCGQQLQGIIGALPPNTRNMIVSTYQLG